MTVEREKFTLTSRLFGYVKGEKVFLYTIDNGEINFSVTNFGGIITEINTPDKKGVRKNVVAGYSKLEDYVADSLYLGSIVGRHANRINKGFFSIDGQKFHLTQNDGDNHLHGGLEGFNRKVWRVEAIINESQKKGITLSYFSKDGEEGYPGNFKVYVTYVLTINNELFINFHATTDRPTIASLTNHTYFNLSGFSNLTVSNHQLKINSDQYLVKKGTLPTGEIAVVYNTPLDFTQGGELKTCLNQLPLDKGLDHCYVLKENDNLNQVQIEVYDPVSGRRLLLKTNQPAIQIYSANYWDGTGKNENEIPLCQHGAIALETQGFSDAPNHAHFPSTIIYPNMIYKTTTIFQFITE